MNEQLTDYIKQHPKLIAAQDFELNCQKAKIEKIQFLDGKELLSNEEHAWWIHLKVLHRNKPGAASTVVPSEESLSRLIEQALKNAEQSCPDPWFRFPLWSNKSERRSQPTDARPKDFWNSSFTELGELSTPFQEEYEWWQIEGSIFRRSEKSTKTFQHQLPKQSLFLGRLHETFWGMGEERKVRALNLKQIQALENAPEVHRGVPPGVFSLSSRAMAPILEHVSQWFLPQFIRKGASPFALEDREAGSLSSCLNLMDDGSNPASPWHAPFDLEGVSTQKTVLLEKGVFREALYDSYQGAIDNRRSTGNSLRNFRGTEPSLGFRHLFLSPGQETENELWGRHQNGYALESWSQISFPSSLEVEGTLCGWEVSQGSHLRPVKIAGIRWNLVELLSRVTQVGSIVKNFNFISTPTLFFEDLT